MDAQELRIGNLINNVFGQPITVGLSQIKFAKDFKPIPLTEEWLLKFGFKLNGVNKAINIDGPEGDFCFTANNFGKNIRIQIQYVHQLQNLYFALTGEELILKDK